MSTLAINARPQANQEQRDHRDVVLEYVVSGGSLRFEDAQGRFRLVLEAAIQAAAAARRA